MASESARWIVVMIGVMMVASMAAAQEKGIAVVPKESEKRVDVTVDGQPFTSYIWPEVLKVPTLYPLLTASGTAITRGFPIEPRVGERVDHPHHAGLWFNYGNVNGVDFWNNSTFVSEQQQSRMGTVVHKRIVKATSGAEKGELEIETDWIMPDGSKVLGERA